VILKEQIYLSNLYLATIESIGGKYIDLIHYPADLLKETEAIIDETLLDFFTFSVEMTKITTQSMSQLISRILY
jgi:hypothetical protein